MIKKTFTFEDYDGNERTRDYYFDLNEVELSELAVSVDGGLKKKVENIAMLQDRKEIIKIFKEIISMSYGVKSDDGVRFIKNKEVLDGFIQSKAYPMLFMELANDYKKASEFIKGIIPPSMDVGDAVVDEENKIIAQLG